MSTCCTVYYTHADYFFLFFFKATATTEIYTYVHTLSPHDSLPISSTGWRNPGRSQGHAREPLRPARGNHPACPARDGWRRGRPLRCRWLRDCPDRSRSEEHTSELQSLMRISYAVFCLKKKIQYKDASTRTTYRNTLDSNTKR